MELKPALAAVEDVSAFLRVLIWFLARFRPRGKATLRYYAQGEVSTASPLRGEDVVYLFEFRKSLDRRSDC